MKSIINKSNIDIKPVIGLIGAGLVLSSLIALGQLYRHQCMQSGKDIDQCWDKGLAIAGMGMGGPLSAGVVIGYVLGVVNKEKEKREQYEQGYWTLNPELRENFEE